MRNSLKAAAVLAALALLSTTAQAQAGGRAAARQQGAPAAQQGAGRTIEFGIDGDFAVHFADGDDLTEVALPNAVFRMGFHRNPTWSIEPYASINSVSTDGASERELMIGVGLPWHFSTIRTMNQWYARPFVGLTNTAVDIDAINLDESTTQFHLGAGFGLKMPLADRFGARFEVLLAHSFETDEAAGFTTLGLRGGLSFYTR